MIHQPKHDKKFSILYVDDEEKALKYFERAFRDDFHIMTASSVDLALNILEKKGDEIGVLITDQRMPDKNGTELLKFIRQERPGIVRLLTTAYSDLETAIEAVNRGEIFRYINKPWELSNLRMDLRNALDFFNLRRERDFLIQEKLSARYRLKQSDRIHDFIIMAGSFTQIRHPLHALNAFLHQIPFDTLETESTQNIDWASLDLWSHMEQETERMLMIAQSTIEHTQMAEPQNGMRMTAPSPNGFQDYCHIKTLLKSVQDDLEVGNQRIHLNIPETLRPLKMNKILLSCMFKTLIEKVIAATAPEGNIRISTEDLPQGMENGVSLSMSSDQTKERIQDEILFAPAQKENSTSMAAYTAFLSAFFICYHHGGTIHITANDHAEIKITIFLPLDPVVVEFPPLDTYWLEKIFARLEI